MGSYKGSKKRFADVERELVSRERKDVKAHTGPKENQLWVARAGILSGANENSVATMC